MVLSAVHSYHSANQLFADTLNSLHPMALATKKEDNEYYTFKQMLRQPDAADFYKDDDKRDSWLWKQRSLDSDTKVPKASRREDYPSNLGF